jgi:hypothetical protein
MADVVQQYLQSRGATPSAENASRVRQHYASNPDLLDRRANGLPGGLDDNSSVLDALLDKHLAESMPTPAGTVTVGQPEAIPPPSRTAPMVKGKGEVGGTASVATGDPASGNRGGGRQGYGEVAPVATPAQTADSQYSPSTDDVANGGIGEWLKALLGISAAVPAAENIVGRAPAQVGAPPAALPPPQQRITSQVGPNVESVGQEMQTIDQRNQAGKTQQRAQVQESVDAENDAMMRKMEEDARKQRAQRNAQETVNAAKRVTGRR